VGQDSPEDKLQSPDAIERMSQDADALILASKRLAEELQALAERAQELIAQQVASTVVVRLLGGPADGLVFVVPQRNVPKFFGVGYPVSNYFPQPGNAAVRLFRYVENH
jgi:hypothetical protein